MPVYVPLYCLLPLGAVPLQVWATEKERAWLSLKRMLG